MKTPPLILLAASLCLFALPATAFECTNAGAGSTAPNDNGVAGRTACGNGANAVGANSTALGGSVVAAGNNSTALGESASSAGVSSTAVGSLASSTGPDSTAVGVLAISAGNLSTALGRSASSAGADSTAVGVTASSAGSASTAVGRAAASVGSGSTALGRSASSSGNLSTALGYFASSIGNDSTALGRVATSAGLNSSALGASASSAGSNSTALGASASAEGNSSTALGVSASSAGNSSTALGVGSSSPGNLSTALGVFASSAGENSTALGVDASAPNDNTMVLGSIPGVGFGTSYVDIANGTTDPLAPLHIFRDDGSAQVLVEETSLDAVPRTLFRLASAGSNAKFEIDNTLAGVNWAFTNSGTDFRISKQGSGVVEFIVDNNGNAFVYNDLIAGGNITGNVNLLSDRNLKQNVQAIDAQAVLDKVANLPVSAWEYTSRPGEQHIGPMAQDFRAAFGLGGQDTSISVVDAAGVALASIQALEQRNQELEALIQKLAASNQEQETLIKELAANNQEQETRLAQLESVETQVADLRALVVQLLPQVAQN